MKKIISTAIAAFMICSCFSVPVLAEHSSQNTSDIMQNLSQPIEKEAEPFESSPQDSQQAQESAGQIYYVDGNNGNDENNGQSEEQAWKTLEKVNQTEFQPGDKILLKAGSIWDGQLCPQGSGVQGSPIIIDQYGEGNRPIINGNGKVTETLRLRNQQYWEISNLELTNKGDTPAPRRAVWVENNDFGVMNHIYLKNLFIHDVNGRVSDRYYEDGGIICMVTGGKVESHFNDILIEGNTFYKVDYDGIFIRNNWKNRASITDGIGPWIGNTNVVVKNNNLDNIGGDGIVVCESIAPLIEYNVAKDCHIRATSTWSAGIWVINSKDALLQFNEGYLTRGDLDGQPFDCDGQCENTVYQYNYSHDNEGGFMLICNWTDPSKDFNKNGVVRYNISQNDRSKIFHYSGINTGFQIYNNTIYVGEGNQAVFSRENGVKGSSVTFTNNIFYNEGNNFEYNNRATAVTFNNNLYYGNHPKSEPDDPRKVVADPRLVAPGTGGIGLNTVGGYKLLPDSPAINQGVAIPNNGGRDYFGNPLPTDDTVDIGAHEYTNDSAPITFDPGKVWNAAEDYSCVTGQNQWSALMISGPNSTQTTWSDAKQCWVGPTDYAVIDKTELHPAPAHDAARCFTAPVAGTYQLTGTVRKSNVKGGDGVVASIRVGKGNQIWNQPIAFNDNKGFEYNLTVKLDIGEKVYFIVGRNKNDEFDQTEWNPTVTLTQLSERLEVEGENGTMKGQTKEESLRNASRGKIVGFLGKGAGNDVTYTVQVAHAGEYAIKLHAVTGETRSIFCDVNGAPASKVEVPAGQWWAVQQAAPMIVTLEEGENTIRFYNDLAYAPSIDKFVIVEQ